MAITYHQLGRVAQDRGHLDDAEDWYRQSLTIKEQLGNRPGMANTYGQLGLLAEARDEPAARSSGWCGASPCLRSSHIRRPGQGRSTSRG